MPGAQRFARLRVKQKRDRRQTAARDGAPFAFRQGVVSVCAVGNVCDERGWCAMATRDGDTRWRHAMATRDGDTRWRHAMVVCGGDAGRRCATVVCIGDAARWRCAEAPCAVAVCGCGVRWRFVSARRRARQKREKGKLTATALLGMRRGSPSCYAHAGALCARLGLGCPPANRQRRSRTPDDG